jgi:hypothetical protein
MRRFDFSDFEMTLPFNLDICSMFYLQYPRILF